MSAQQGLPNVDFSQLGYGLNPNVQNLVQQLSARREAQLGAIKPEKVDWKDLLAGVLLGPAGAVALHYAGKQRNQRQRRQVEQDYMGQLAQVAAITQALNSSRNDFGATQTVAPLMQQYGLPIPQGAQVSADDAVKFLGGLSNPDAVRGAARVVGQGTGQGLDYATGFLEQLGAIGRNNKADSKPVVSKVPVSKVPGRAEDSSIDTMNINTPDRPRELQFDPGMMPSANPASATTVTGGVSHSPRTFMSEDATKSLIAALTQASNNAMSNAPSFAKLPYEQSALEALELQREAAAQLSQQNAALSALRRQLLPAESAALVGQRRAAAGASGAVANYNRARAKEINELLPGKLSLQAANAAKATTGTKSAVLDQYSKGLKQWETVLEQSGLIDPKTGQIRLPRNADKATESIAEQYFAWQQAQLMQLEEAAGTSGLMPRPNKMFDDWKSGK